MLWRNPQKNRCRAALPIGTISIILLISPFLNACSGKSGEFGESNNGKEQNDVEKRSLTKRPSNTKLVLLGTGTPIPEIASSGPATAVVTGGRAYLVDAGVGIVRQAQAAFEKGTKELQPDLLSIVFFTHLHSDHTLGYPDLIFTPWIIGADQGLDVYGPPGIKEMTQHILNAWSDDLYIREKSKDPTQAIANKIRIHEISPGQVYKDSAVTVTAVPVHHGDWEHVYGYKFNTGEKNIVISGDTTPTKTIISACGGCDILLHEVYSNTGYLQGPPSWRKYHSEFHTSTVELANLAKAAKPKQLVLYHKLFFGQTDDGLVKEITDHYKGKVSLGHDLDVYE